MSWRASLFFILQWFQLRRQFALHLQTNVIVSFGSLSTYTVWFYNFNSIDFVINDYFNNKKNDSSKLKLILKKISNNITMNL